MMKRRIAIIGDVHGNFRALCAARDAALAQGCDEFVILGDLLSYGLDVASVLDEVADLCTSYEVKLLRGNHDALYLDDDSVWARTYENKLPDWIRESVVHTRSRLSKKAFSNLPFINECQIDGFYFSHANPFGPGNWRYLNTDEEHRDCLAVLAGKGVLAGVFGHTHRARLVVNSDLGLIRLPLPQDFIPLSWELAPYCVNPGSVGQPRDTERSIYILVVETGVTPRLKFVEVNYDIQAFIHELKSSTLSVETKRELLKYFS